MTIIFDGTQGITTPTETANNSVTTPVVKSGSALTLQTNGSTTAVTIDTSQNVGIGTISPQMRVDVSGGVRVQSITNPTSGSGMELAYDGTQGIIQAYSNRTTLASVPVYLVTGQLRFPPTQNPSSDANTLDDYEEGSWTPNVYHSSSNNSSWSEKLGTYRKVGSIVHCWFECDGGNSGTSGSDLTIGGLPFTPTTTPSKVSFGIWGANGITPNTGNIFNAGGTPLLYNGGNALTTQISYVSGYFCYVAS